ncbi:MAG: TolC family protein [Magnetococcales bacterium]|nr:TolC family protein [Magnetococcales bacterium]
MSEDFMVSCRLLWVAAALFTLVPVAQAEEKLVDVIVKVLDGNEKIQAAQSDLVAAQKRIAEVYGNAWYPSLQTVANYGRERRESEPLAANTDMYPRELDIKLAQKIWDFDKSNADTRIMKLQYLQAAETLETVRQTVILDAISAYMNFKRVETALDYAKQSEANILKQTEVENTKVQAGQGYTTDVLQAKTQLAGAQARRIQAEGTLSQVHNRVQSVFKRDIKGVVLAEELRVPYHLLPKGIDEAADKARQDNPQIKNLSILADVLADKRKALRSERFFPVFNASLERKFKESVQGVEGFTQETLAKVELTHQLNLGLTGLTAIDAAVKDEEAARFRLDDAVVQVSEQVKNAWNNLETAKANAAMLRNQAELAERFLEVARQERQMGRRSLLDVLNGETALINSRSDASAAEADISIAAYTLLKEMGHLTLQEISRMPTEAEKAARPEKMELDDMGVKSDKAVKGKDKSTKRDEVVKESPGKSGASEKPGKSGKPDAWDKVSQVRKAGKLAADGREKGKELAELVAGAERAEQLARVERLAAIRPEIPGRGEVATPEKIAMEPSVSSEPTKVEEVAAKVVDEVGEVGKPKRVIETAMATEAARESEQLESLGTTAPVATIGLAATPELAATMEKATTLESMPKVEAAVVQAQALVVRQEPVVFKPMWVIDRDPSMPEKRVVKSGQDKKAKISQWNKKSTQPVTPGAGVSSGTKDHAPVSKRGPMKWEHRVEYIP